MSEKGFLSQELYALIKSRMKRREQMSGTTAKYRACIASYQTWGPIQSSMDFLDLQRFERRKIWRAKFRRI